MVVLFLRVKALMLCIMIQDIVLWKCNGSINGCENYITDYRVFLKKIKKINENNYAKTLQTEKSIKK